MKRVGIALFLVALLSLPSCTVTVFNFEAPAAVAPGEIFEIVLWGDWTGTTPTDTLGVVIQLPIGFTVLGGWNSDAPISPLFQNAANYVGLFTAEPNSTLTSFSGSGVVAPAGQSALRVRIQAPSTPGAFVLKAAAASTINGLLTPQSTGGVTNFSAITANANVESILVTNAGSPERWIQQSVGLPYFDSSPWCGVTLADVNGDGLDDVIASRNGSAPSPRVFLSTGSGTFVPASTGLTQSFPTRHRVATGDFDGDGNLDIAAGGQAWLGDGGFSWTSASIGLTGGTSEGVAVGDFNSDGLDDVVFTSAATGTIQGYSSDGDGSWTLSLTSSIGSTLENRSVRMDDVNGDGNLDVVWVQTVAPLVVYGDGAGNWLPSALPLSLFGIVTDVGIGDLDGDGRKDLAVTTDSVPLVGMGSPGIYLLLQRGPVANPTWTVVTGPTIGLPLSDFHDSVDLFDLDGDGDLDIIAGRVTPNPGIAVWLNDGSASFSIQVGTPIMEGLPQQWTGPILDIAAGSVLASGETAFAFAHDLMGIVVRSDTGTPTFGPCGSGTVGTSTGLFGDTVTVNGISGVPSRRVVVGVNAPITIDVGPPPASSGSADFALFGAIGIPNPSQPYSTTVGDFCFPPAILLPFPGLFTVANSFAPGPGPLVPSASPAPWTVTESAGIPFPFDIVIQGVIVETTSPTITLSVTNAVHIAVR